MFRWQRYGGYEVSSKGDRRFSAFYARLRDGRSIEEAYQLDVKGYRKYGNSPMLGKGKRPIRNISHDQQWAEYLGLWKQWARENPALIAELKVLCEKAGGCLSDRFANTDINQARALAEILNSFNI